MAAHILVVSPIPSHPQDQGNSARIHAVCRRLQAEGLVVHFLYYPLEGLTPAQRAEMEACWDHLHVVPTRPLPGMRGPGPYALDDWYDPAVSEAARRLDRRWHFRAVLANYVWFSGVLDALDGDALRILDTHDVFGDRHLRFLDAGMQPEWYFTTRAAEARGLARADIVLAIQDEEAALFRGYGHPDVRVLGHLLSQRRRLAPVPSPGGARIGYLASGNPLNVQSFRRMQARLAGRAPAAELLVAGTICDRVGADAAPFRVLGRLGHVDGFYDRVDAVANPMGAGTGLKIKSVEALFQGVPLIATSVAMVGLPALHELHALETPEDVADAAAAGLSAPLLRELAAASARAAGIYGARVRQSVAELARGIRG